jgi:hypothetical protein
MEAVQHPYNQKYWSNRAVTGMMGSQRHRHFSWYLIAKISKKQVSNYIV